MLLAHQPPFVAIAIIIETPQLRCDKECKKELFTFN